MSVDHFMQFCKDANIDEKHTVDSIKKYILAYQRNLEHKGAFQILFKENPFINWEYIGTKLARVDAKHWINILNEFFDLSAVKISPRSVLGNIQTNLKALGLEDTPEFVCQVFLLTNLNFVTAQHGLERLLCERGDVADPTTKSLQFLARSADNAFNVLDTTAIFCQLMKECTVYHAKLEKQMQFANIREEELATSFKVKQIRATSGRVRLRSKLADVKKEAKTVDGDVFEAWGQAIKFPNVFSQQMKQRLYFLMSQNIHSPAQHAHRITTDSHVRKALEGAQVRKPDVEILVKVITSLRVTDEPFNDLREFREQCTGAFPIKERNALLLNDYLHMYVCAYQNQWTEIWKHVAPLLSHQIVKDVENFVAKNPYRFDAVLDIMGST